MREFLVRLFGRRPRARSADEIALRLRVLTDALRYARYRERAAHWIRASRIGAIREDQVIEIPPVLMIRTHPSERKEKQ